MRERYDEIRKLIESNPGVAKFADFGNGVSDGWIEKAEKALNLTLPNSYKWWLRSYGGGEVAGEEIFSIYEEDFDTVVGGDIVYMYRVSSINPKAIPICHSDIDGVFYFDASNSSEDEEYPVDSGATGKVYAKDFLDFLTKRITLNLN